MCNDLRLVALRLVAIRLEAAHEGGSARPGPPGRASEITTRSGALRRFVTHPRPPVLLGTVGCLAALRAARGRLGWADARIALACMAAHPFVEWSVHRGLLHARPAGALGRACYRLVGRGHERHHRDPVNMDTMFIGSRDMTCVGAVATAVATFGTPGAATGALCVGLGLLAYDWTHFLIHTGYRPRSPIYRQMWYNHRLHHYRNERYWLGVTSPIGDILLGTNPPRDAVPVSVHAARPTARLARAPS
jgi:hypothetical protein